jgi:L-ascorbate metabolism protein UlaG (beta-lactamase superfamily)
VLLPVHWGKFSLAFHAWQEPIRRLTAKAKTENVAVITPKIGEMVNSDKLQNVQLAWWEGENIL